METQPQPDISTAYEPKNIEKTVYEWWEKSGYFNPDNLPHAKEKGVKSYGILMPLPNVTGSLHIGHALDHTIQDALVRYHRMRGYRAYWLPGTDHAGIATQNVVEKQLRKEGKSRFEMGREEFVKKVWEWKQQYGSTIERQERMLGDSCDWSRARFTMDDAYAKDVVQTFVHYYETGLIYRGKRVVNWCARCGTSLSELEIEYKEEKTKLVYIQYPLASGSGHITVATTRPETMLGDAAVAVHPSDERYKKVVGQEIVLPLVGRRIPIVADRAIDQTFGTGAVKVTPSHDMADSDIASRHDLPFFDIINERGKMVLPAGSPYEGLSVKDAREKVMTDLRAAGAIEKEEEYAHNLATCYRCGASLEPQRSSQWFIRMKGSVSEGKKRTSKKEEKKTVVSLRDLALNAVKFGHVKINPKKFEKTYTAWLKGIKDWCISRQLWWGHQIPAWFCEASAEAQSEAEERFIVAAQKPAKCPFCGGCDMKQSTDVLDTWFSSALWPFAGLSEADRKKLYPTSVLVTARDIINLWVMRMVFSGMEFMGKPPFHTALIHGTVLTKDGKRMSKSLGTGIDPLTIIETYGADALRFAVIWQSMGQQDVRWADESVIAGKKFANKMWNASRFVRMKWDKKEITKKELKRGIAKFVEHDKDAKKIWTEYLAMKGEFEAEVAEFKLGHALHRVYDYFWHEFCDKTIESFKANETAEAKLFLLGLLIEQLKLMHPIMPFVTEYIYSQLPVADKDLLMVEQVL
jgi:valyl-tRNA synthetase